MWFWKKESPEPSEPKTKPEILYHKTVSRRGDLQLDYFKVKLSKPLPRAKNEIEVFYGKKADTHSKQSTEEKGQ